MSYNAAIESLENQINNLTQGINSIPEQEAWIEEHTGMLATARERLSDDKKALLELKNALELLKAGS